jgi:6-pyruvoyltetrahydropterin/6-carboxytetrahydropterin synthase
MKLTPIASSKPSRDWKPMKISLTTATISRSYTFEAAHHLPSLPPMHKCRRMHGHSYKVDVRISGPVDEAGLVYGIEFGRLDIVMEPIVNSVDHNCWNDKLETPTVENIAGYLAQILCEALQVPVTVRVHEGPRSWAEVSLGSDYWP